MTTDDQPVEAPPVPRLLTVTAHGSPSRALYYGFDATPAIEALPCSIKRLGQGAHRVQVDGLAPWRVGPRQKVWLAPLPGEPVPQAEYSHARRPVARPTIVPLRLPEPTIDAYRLLAHALTGAARAADDAAAVCQGMGQDAQAADLRSVRDALRGAATASLLGRGFTTPEPCTRCGTSCTACDPREVTE